MTAAIALPASLLAQQGEKKGIALGHVGKASLAQIEEKAEEFEAVFLHEMLNHMVENMPTDGMFGGGEAEGIYRSMMTDEYAKLITSSGGIGVADYVKREMIAMQEKKG